MRFAWLGVLMCGGGLAADDGVDFQRDIRPLLSAKCFACHGPDAEARQGELRLDLVDDATRSRGDHAAIVPGDPAKSELLRRITSTDDAERMPPPESKKTVSDRERDLLKRWIAGGAQYAEHWAYVKPQRPALPSLTPTAKAWSRNEIDRFIAQRHIAAGMTSSPEATKATWLRRVSLDLIGLPPTPAELQAFVADETSSAYERVVDRLLSSPRFGERWASPWLDLARYADSNGYQADQLRDSWAYRDWVIDALNADLPFDQFTIEQLAGDLLPDATFAQRVATGFHRTVTCNVEAGVQPEENRTNQVIDRVNTTATVWLGLTLECAQCHDHKYDPFTSRDYYRMFAYFNNTPLEVQNKSGKGVQFEFFGPNVELPLPATLQAERAKLQASLGELEARRTSLMAELGTGRDEWEAKLRGSLDRAAEWHVLPVATFESGGGEDHRVLDDQSILITGRVPEATTYTVTVRTTLANVTAFKVEALTHPEITGTGPGRGDADRPNFILSEFDVTAVTRTLEASGSLEFASADADYEQARYPVSAAIDGNRKTGWAIGQQFGKPHHAVFKLTKPLNCDGETALVFTLDQQFGQGRTIGRLRLSALVGEEAATVPDDVAAILKKDKRTAKEKKRLDEFFTESNPKLAEADKQLSLMKLKLDKIEPPTTLVMVELPEPRTTQMLKRGNYLTPGDAVAPGTPEKLHPLDPKFPPTRLGLAQWLVSTDNPLTARVTVNRWWAELFGRGLVTTLEDFGLQSEPPTHPELLDWLAVEFMTSPDPEAQAWSMKRMLKRMVLSATYRQASRLTPELAERDPENALYARGPRFRLSAETIRDQALAASGLLSTKQGGEPIMPHQPTNIWRAVGRNAPKWVDAKDEDRFRRGVYVVWRRAAPYPSFVNFDAPDRASCTVNRPRTNTPLQALTLLNDPASIEMAVALASRVLTESPSADMADRIDYATQLVLSRTASSLEREELQRFHAAQRQKLSSRPDDVAALLKAVAAVKLPDGLDPVDLAAWFHVANLLLNLDETVTRG
ncbi:MAG: PSD1 and planctomycete cytochrome C domain-containing protein [Planctomycetaceae bacterium]|nr:PSD1 and planctomycete cytochrome C domain-containing protein [Planctomycetaceae bacterium]